MSNMKMREVSCAALGGASRARPFRKRTGHGLELNAPCEVGRIEANLLSQLSRRACGAFAEALQPAHVAFDPARLQGARTLTF